MKLTWVAEFTVLRWERGLTSVLGVAARRRSAREPERPTTISMEEPGSPACGHRVYEKDVRCQRRQTGKGWLSLTPESGTTELQVLVLAVGGHG